MLARREYGVCDRIAVGSRVALESPDAIAASSSPPNPPHPHSCDRCGPPCGCTMLRPTSQAYSRWVSSITLRRIEFHGTVLMNGATEFLLNGNRHSTSQHVTARHISTKAAGVARAREETPRSVSTRARVTDVSHRKDRADLLLLFFCGSGQTANVCRTYQFQKLYTKWLGSRSGKAALALLPVLRHQVQPYPSDSRFVVGLIAWSIMTPVGAFLKTSVLRKMLTFDAVPTAVPAYGLPGWYLVARELVTTSDRTPHTDQHSIRMVTE